MEWDFFFRQLEAGINIDETCLVFADDPDEHEHYLGYLPQFKKPYWVGYCDIEDGCEFESAKELVEAPIFDGKSLRERWNSVVIWSIGGTCLEDWIKYCSDL